MLLTKRTRKHLIEEKFKMVYKIVKSNELYHFGVKGMKWGVRKQPEKAGTSRTRKSLSTAKKVAMGLAVAAAVGGVSYYAIKTHKYNKAAHAAVQRALMVNNGKVMKTEQWREAHAAGLPRKAIVTRPNRGMYTRGDGSWYKKPNEYAKLTGHSQRLTKYGAAGHRGRFYGERALKYPLNDESFNDPFHPKRVLGRRSANAFAEQSEILKNFNSTSGKNVPRIRSERPINRLKRQKGPRILRVRG